MDGKSTERHDEEQARHIVATVLGVPVDRFDYGTAPRQVDGLVRYPDREAALEVVADHDPTYNKQVDALSHVKHKVEVPGLRKSWIVTLSREAKINKVKQALPALLLDLQDNPRPKRPSWDVESSELDRLGIISAIDAGTVPGRVYLVSDPWGGFGGHEGTVGAWVTRVLAEQPDVPNKLAAHPGVAERHAFIWATPTSDMGVQVQLEPGNDHPFPVMPPALPSGVTHVWVAGSVWRQGVLAWFPDGGWWRTPWTWPSEGPMTVGDQADY